MPVALLISLFASAAKIDKQDISLFSLAKSSKNLQKVAEKYEIIKANPNTVEIYVPRFKISTFLSLAPSAKLLEKSIYANEALLRSAKSFGKNYKKYSEVLAIMENLVKKYPNLVKLGTYGETIKDSKLYFLKISDNVKTDENEPEIMITAATHGDELITTESLIRFIQELLESQHKTRSADLVNDYELYFIPFVNPDAFKRRRRYTAEGTDPNRSYPYPGNTTLKPVQCIQELINFFHSRNFVASMDLHASGEMIMYPWAYTKDEVPAADKNLFESLGESMALDNGYKVGQISKIIYVAPASSADYYYWQKGTIAYGIELAKSKAPMSWSIKKVVAETTSMIYTFIERF